MEQSPAPSSSSFAAYQARKRFSNLDGLRFICIMMVLWHHYSPVPQETMQLLSRGFLGVDFFFVLSGYLITTLLLRERQAKGHFSMKGFYIRRFLRIVPVYFFVVTCVAMYYIGVKGETQHLDMLPYYYLFLSNFLVGDIPLLGPTWSLSVEEQYYMIWPLVMLLLPVRWLIPVCGVFVVLSFLVAVDTFGVDAIPLGILMIRPPTATYAPIIMGSMAAILLHRESSFIWLHRFTAPKLSSFLGFIALVLFMQFGPWSVVGWPNLVLHSLMTFTLIALVVRDDVLLSSFLQHPWIMRFGAVSYGIYLYHLIALDFVSRAGSALGGISPWVIFVGYTLLSYLIAELSFRTLEAYFQRFRPKH